MKRPVAVLGATGQVGLFAIAGLLKAGRNVLALTREEPSGAAGAIDRCRAMSLAHFVEHIHAGGEEFGDGLALLSCGPVALVRQVLEAGAEPGASVPFTGWERVVVIGTTSVSTKRRSTDAAERELISEIEGDLGALGSNCRASGIPLTVLHPTLIYGCGMDRNVSRVYRFIRRYGFAPIARDAAGRRQPLHVADLADTVVRAVLAQPPSQLETAVCGGSTLTYREMLAELFAAAGRPVRFLRIPRFAFPLAAVVSSVAPGAGRVGSEMFSRQSQDLVFGDEPARRILGHDPRPYNPGKADFRLPDGIERIRKALA